MFKSTKNLAASERYRLWTFVVYPDSAPPDWLEQLDGIHVPAVVSPLHEPDKEEGKSHWHVLLKFDGKKSSNQVLEIVKLFNGPQIAFVVESGRSMIRYFCHLDNPEKKQYDISELLPFGGVDIQDLLLPGTQESMLMCEEIEAFCEENDIREFFAICDYARRYRHDDWYFFIKFSPVGRGIRYYLDSRRNAYKEHAYIDVEKLPH